MEKYEYSDSDVDRFMEAALALVEEAGRMITAAIGKQKRVEHKEANANQGNSSTVLTETDSAVEELIISGLKKQFPDHRFIGEESVGDIREYSNHPTWIIDPIDGTMNFVHSCPLVCTSVGLAINRRVVLGIVNNPMTGHRYTAIRGRGAFLNGETRLHTSGVQSLKQAMVLMELPSGANEDKRSTAIENVTNLMKLAEAIRCPGPAALDLAWVSAGSADCFFHFGIHCWDMAAGALMIVEAGGGVLSVRGEEFDLMGRGIVAAASPELARELAANLKVYSTEEKDFPEFCPL